MPTPDVTFTWQEAMTAFAVIALVAFLLTWVVTDLAHISRTPYVAVLTLTATSLAAGYFAWSGTSLAALLTQGWGWGIVGGVLAAAAIAPLVRRLPIAHRPHGARLVRRLLWEGVVYGYAEAILLATLPVLAIWQAAWGLGWTDTTWGAAASGTLAVIGALFVIAVHHLGYRQFRGRASRKLLAGALAGCGVQALAFLLTGNVFAPVIAHIVLHCQLTLRGDEMPPVSEVRVEAPVRSRPVVRATI
jgi:hypothetical protein